MRVPNRSSRGKVALAAAAGAGLVVAPLSFITPAAQAADPVDITVIGTNDFHGRLLNDGRNIPGAAEYAGAVDSIRAENPNSIFAAAGDLIGATTFESFINEDKPTIDVLNEMGLDVSAVGNHELDGGWDDLTKRVMAPESEANPFGGALWEYIAANLVGPAGEEDLIEDSWTTDVAGVTVGFVGAVTEDLPSLVSPAGIEGVQVTDIVEATNTEADRLVAEENADLVVLLVHEGSPSTDCAVVGSPDNVFGQIVTNLNANVDAVVSGHTHLAYECEFPVAGKVAPRPVVSAGQYGSFLNQLDFSVEPETGEVLGVTTELVDVYNGGFTPDPEVQAIVDQAVADAEEPGSVVLGELAEPALLALQPAETGVAVNRGGESVLGNMIAEVQRWATRSDARGGAQIAVMNPGGLRENIEAGELTYKEAALAQPFANTLVNMDMTGAQIKTLLEQQWQPESASRPFLRLGTSRGFEFTYDPEGAPGERITGIFLKNRPLDMGATYSVTANSFLASGGDNFTVFREATNKRDTGVTDLQGMVDYMAAKAPASDPFVPRTEQHAVGVQASKSKVKRGGKVVMDLSSLVMTGEGDVQDKMVRVKLGKKVRGKAPVDPTLIAGGFDESGTATVTVKIPKKAKVGMRYVRVIGNKTGTSVKVPLRITKK